MEQDRYRRECEITNFAYNNEEIREMYKYEIETFLEILGADVCKKADDIEEQIKENGDTPKMRELVNDFFDDELYTFDFPYVPEDYPIQDFKKYIIDCYAETLPFDEWISGNWDTIEEMWLEHYDVIYNANLTKIENDIYNYREKYDYDMKCKEEQSRSWNAGRYPSMYFIFSKSDTDDEEDLDEITLRISDGHDNGRNSDYEMVFDEYDKDELITILDDIRWDLHLED